jgi:hypothetical protein
MAVAVNLTPTYPLQLPGYTFPGYTVILNIVVAMVLTLNELSAQRMPFEETVVSD